MKNKSATGWHLGSRIQYGFFELLVRCRATGLVHCLIPFVVLYYSLLPHIRRRSFPYLKRRFPKAGIMGLMIHTYRLYLNFAHILLDKMIAGVTGVFPLADTDSRLWAHLVKSCQHPHGCIILSAHIGAWQIGLSGLSKLPALLNVVHLSNTDDAGRDTIFSSSKNKNWHIIDATDGMGTLIEGAAALRKGELLCLMGDRFLDGTQRSRAVTVAFLGGEIRLPVNSYALASITGAKLLLIFTIRENGCTKILLAEDIDVPKGLSHRNIMAFKPYAEHFAQAMEWVVQKYPYQFFNFFDMWVENDQKGSHQQSQVIND